MFFSSDAPAWSRHASDNYWQNYYAKARSLPPGGYNPLGKNKGDLVSSDYGKFYQNPRRRIDPVPVPPLGFPYPFYNYPAWYGYYDAYPNTARYNSYPTGNHGNEQKALTEYRFNRDRDKQGHTGILKQ